MKYLIVVAGGLTDKPVAEKDNKTPLMLSETPNLDRLARTGCAGTVQTIPEDFDAGDDVSLLSLLGYDPKAHHAAPAALEAAALGVELGEGEVPVCCDFIKLQSSHNDMVMKDFTGGNLSSEDASLLLEALEEQIEEARFHAGEGPHNLMVIESPPLNGKLNPPNELIGEGIRRFLPEGEEFKDLVYIMNQAQIILHNHPYNRDRQRQGKDTINSVWLWGTGNARPLPAFHNRCGKSGAVVTPSLLFTGMAIAAGMHAVFLRGSRDALAERFREAVAKARDALDTHDVVYLHIPDADTLSLKGNIDDKILAIEDFDSEVMGPVLDLVESRGDVKLLCAVGHMASVVHMKYSKDRVPFLAFPAQKASGLAAFDEDFMMDSPNHFKSGPALLEAFLEERL